MAEIEAGKPRPENDVYRIMVLIENERHLFKIRELCRELGQEVVSVKTIADAMRFLDSKDHVDVVISEAFLENESSFDFLTKLKKMTGHKDVPVMLLAAEPGEVASFCAESLKVTANILGAHKFLVMPIFDAEILMKEVQAVLPEQKTPKRVKDPNGAY